jgi:acetylornithine deacetylase/succinyl-diaminopimelate desuccinylase-like protein
MIFEGDEETSSGDVEKHVLLLKEKIGSPKIIFCLDSGTVDYDRLWVTTSLRGYAVAKIRIDVLKEGVHSGDASGLVPSSFRILSSLIDRLEDHETGYMDKALDVNIPPNRYKELYDLAKEKGVDALKSFETVGDL